MVETEGLLNTRTGEFDFIGRSIPIFPQNDLDVRPGEKAYVKIKAPFCDKLSGMICAKFFSRNVVNTLRIKIQDNQGVVQFVNHQDEIVHLRKEKAVGILDLRSVGYFKVGYQKMVNMAESNKVFKMYHYQQVKCGTETEADQYMKITGKYKTKGSMSQINEEGNVERHKKYDPYPWLTKDDPRRSQSDEEILYEKIDLSDSALSRKEKSRLMKMLIKYRDAFSLRDEIGECPNLKADIKVIDESPFFVRPFPISEKDKPFMDEQMERLVSLGIYLTRKDRPFMWGEAQEKAFKEVKLRLKNPPVLHLPRAEGRFILYSDTSIEGTGSSLWQIQEGKPKLIGYASKTLPEACSRYSVTELEMTGLLVNMNLWKNLLKHREFDAAVDHAAVAQIMKAKTEPATTRIMRLLDRLSAYSFNLYYVKGRDMILADYLSRHRHKDLDPSELIPISFCCLRTYRGLIDDKIGEEIFSVKTRAGAKAIGELVGEVHGADKPLDPNYKPEHQSKSKLPSVIGNKSPIKSVREPPPRTPVRTTPRRVMTPKSVRIQSTNTNDMPNIIQNNTPQQTLMVHGGARPKTKIVGTPMALPSQTHTQHLIPRRILSSTPSGEKGEDVGKDRPIPRIIRDMENKRREKKSCLKT